MLRIWSFSRYYWTTFGKLNFCVTFEVRMRHVMPKICIFFNTNISTMAEIIPTACDVRINASEKSSKQD